MIGKTLDGRYRIVRQLGEGGMGMVFEAEHTGTGRHVAVKVILSEALRGKAEVVQRFQREARMAAAIETQHIVAVLDSGVDPESELPFLVMELMKGEDAAELVRRVGPLRPDVALRIVAQACRGLKKAHEAGVIHRDIKPANLFLARRDEDEVVVKILDFGIAKVMMEEQRAGDQALTRTGAMIGSPLYMSPEQARGHKDIDARADLWSLGVVLYQLLCGRTPFHEIEALGELILAICGEAAPPIQDHAPWVTPEIAAVVHAALRPDPGERYQTAGEMLTALAPLMPNGVGLTTADLAGVAEAAKAPAPREATVAGLARTGPVETQPVRRWSPWHVAALTAVAVIAGYLLYARLEVAPARPAPKESPVSSLRSSAEDWRLKTEDSTTLVVLADGFSGYLALRRPELGAALADAGVTLRYEDEPDQAARARRLGESADLMATTLDQVLLHRPRGRIVALIDATAGADAVVLNQKRYPELTSLEALGPWATAEAAAGRKPRVAFAAGTPSEYLALLLDARFVSFQLEAFEQQRVADASAAFAALESEPAAAVAVLWEPYVTRAERAGQRVVLSSADVPEAIVDVLLASERLLAERPELCERVVGAYYRRIDAGFVEPSRLIAELADDGKLPAAEAKTIADGVRFFSALRARDWVESGKLARRIEATAAILVLAGRLREPPRDPAALFMPSAMVAAAKTTESLIATVRAEQPELAARLEGREQASAGGEVDLKALAGAPVLGSVAMLAFAPGSDTIDASAQAALGAAVEHAADFNPATTVVVVTTAGADELARRRGEHVRVALRGLGLPHRIAVRSNGAGDGATLELVRAR